MDFDAMRCRKKVTACHDLTLRAIFHTAKWLYISEWSSLAIALNLRGCHVLTCGAMSLKMALALPARTLGSEAACTHCGQYAAPHRASAGEAQHLLDSSTITSALLAPLIFLTWHLSRPVQMKEPFFGYIACIAAVKSMVGGLPPTREARDTVWLQAYFQLACEFYGASTGRRSSPEGRYIACNLEQRSLRNRCSCQTLS